jgi:hypothetical protein
MTNFDKLFEKEMKNPEFVYHFEKAKFERKVIENLNIIEEKIKNEKPSLDAIISMIDSFKLNVAQSNY